MNAISPKAIKAAANGHAPGSEVVEQRQGAKSLGVGAQPSCSVVLTLWIANRVHVQLVARVAGRAERGDRVRRAFRRRIRERRHRRRGRIERAAHRRFVMQNRL